MKRKLTKHAKIRLNNRLGLKATGMRSLFTKALLYGVSPHNMPECKAKNYLMRKVNRKASVKLYQETVFIYKNGRLITAYKLPKSVK